MIKKVVIWGVVVLTLSIALLLLVPLSFFLFNRDIDDVKLSGRVYDKASKKPLSGVELVIENWMYDGGDYDGFSKSEKYRKTTDTKGHYSITIPKSAWIVVYASKEGYVNDTVSSYTSKSTEIAIALKKISK